MPSRTRRSRTGGPAEDGAELPSRSRAARRTCSTACSTRACCRATPSRLTSSPSTSSTATSPSGSTPSSGTRRARASRRAQPVRPRQGRLDRQQGVDVGRDLLADARATASRRGDDRWLYFECQVCHYAMHVPTSEAERGDERDCPACGAVDKFGKAMNWMRPPGFAHRAHDGPRNQPRRRASRSATPPGPSWSPKGRSRRASGRRSPSASQQTYDRDTLLVTNTGPRTRATHYCTRCGLIEPTKSHRRRVWMPAPQAVSRRGEPDCPGIEPRRGTGARHGLHLGRAARAASGSTTRSRCGRSCCRPTWRCAPSPRR